MVKMDKGYFVISLDFELMWGNIESWDIDGYGRTHVANVEEVIDRLLTLFEKYQVRATVATVGLIMNKNYHDLTNLLPKQLPTYNNNKLSPYERKYIENIPKEHNKLYFAPEIVEKLKKSPYIEIGTHTYGHYYCWEEGQTIEQFEADISKAVEVASENGIKLESIVFPRNQVSPEYNNICEKYGISSYRGNAKKYFEHSNSKWKNIKNKICRLLDAYINIGGNTSYKLDTQKSGILNIPASRFLRPYSHKLAFAEKLRLHRITKEMKHASRNNEVYHLWWHPHNFGQDIEENFSFLEKILQNYQKLHQDYGMTSATMSMISEQIIID